MGDFNTASYPVVGHQDPGGFWAEVGLRAIRHPVLALRFRCKFPEPDFGTAVSISVRSNFRMARDPTEASPTSGHGHPRASSVKFARRLSLDAGGNRSAITILVYD